ncbi:MAG: hypothetical protein WCA30_09345 [Dermatophilaceae bacterium]
MRTRWAVLASAGIMTLVASGCGEATVGPGTLPGAETFEVPTYAWNGDGMDALVTGRLAFTDEGCALIYQPGQETLVTPVVFPDAEGVRFANGVRAVTRQGSGEVFAVEGQEFSYGGGWVPPGRGLEPAVRTVRRRRHRLDQRRAGSPGDDRRPSAS